MIRNAVSLASSNAPTRLFLKAQSALLVRSVASLAAGGSFSSIRSRVSDVSHSTACRGNEGSSTETFASPRRFQSTWTQAHNHRRRGGLHTSSTAFRPIINGKPVAFHVNDLCAPSFSYSNSEPNGSKSQKKQYDSDLIVVLDMDECLIHSKFLNSASAAQVYAHQLQQQQRRLSSTVAASSVDSFRVNLPDGDLVHVFVRPGLENFLKAVTDRFETHIFTAAMPIYADPVLDKLDPDGTRFAARWFRDSCTFEPLTGHNHGGAYVKNLERLPATADQLDRVVLVDNNPLSFLANPTNGILVNSFYNDPTDSTLPAVLKLLDELDGQPDVRPVLQERFALQESLQDIGRNNKSQQQEDVVVVA